MFAIILKYAQIRFPLVAINYFQSLAVVTSQNATLSFAKMESGFGVYQLRILIIYTFVYNCNNRRKKKTNFSTSIEKCLKFS